MTDSSESELFLMTDQDGYDATEESHEKTNLYIFHNSSLRIHDNPSLLKSIVPGKLWRAVFILDVYQLSRVVGSSRNRFLLESMHSIEESLRKLDSRLYVIQGHPVLSLEKVIDDWNVESVFFEGRIDRGGRMVDQSITSLCQGKGVSVTVCHSHTLYDPDQLSPFAHDGPITNFNLFEEVIQKMGLPKPPLNSPTRLHDNLDKSSQYAIPSSEVLGVPPNSMFQGMWVGGEKEGLKRLEVYITKRLKNKGKTTFLDEPTALSPYIRFGCLSTKLIFQRCCQEKDKDFIHSVYSRMASRDFFLHLCSTVPNFEVMKGNPLSLQLPWEYDPVLFEKWQSGNTGYPMVDAAMRQLVQEGFIHHSLREVVACFLTRGDLWISWVKGRDVFGQYLLDYEPGICSGSWMKSSCSAFIGETIEHYNPVTFGQKVDPEGVYIKRFLPQLKDVPPEYIYIPWTMPLAVQQEAKCIVGRDYPLPIVDHMTAGSICSERLKFTIHKFCSVFRQKYDSTTS